MLMFIISLIIGGLIIGALARLILPGRDPMGIPLTILVGVGGSLLGGLIGKALFGRPGGFILALICAVLIVFIIRRTRGARPLP